VWDKLGVVMGLVTYQKSSLQHGYCLSKIVMHTYDTP